MWNRHRVSYAIFDAIVYTAALSQHRQAPRVFHAVGVCSALAFTMIGY